MVSEPRNELMAWMETDYSKHTLSMEDKMAGAFGRAKSYGWDGFFESWRGGLYPGWGGAAAHNRKQLMGLKTSILVPRSFSLPAPPARTLWYEKITSRALFGISLKKTVSCNSLFRFNLIFLRGKEEGGPQGQEGFLSWQRVSPFPHKRK